MSDKIKINMVLARSTKGTHVYTNENVDTAVPTLYINRKALPQNPPEFIEVEISFTK